MNLYRGGGLVLKSSPTLVTSWTVAYQAPLSLRFPKEDYWREFLFPSPGYLPDSWVEPESPALQADSLPTEPSGKPYITISFFFLIDKQQLFIIWASDSNINITLKL